MQKNSLTISRSSFFINLSARNMNLSKILYPFMMCIPPMMSGARSLNRIFTIDETIWKNFLKLHTMNKKNLQFVRFSFILQSIKNAIVLPLINGCPRGFYDSDENSKFSNIFVLQKTTNEFAVSVKFDSLKFSN